MDNVENINSDLKPTSFAYSHPGALRIAKIVQQRFADWAHENTDTSRGTNFLTIDTLPINQWIDQHIFIIETDLTKKSRMFHQLSVPSQRAILWLSFLKEPGNLLAHLNSLVVLHSEWHAHVPNEKIVTEIKLYNTASLIRTRSKANLIEITLHEGFIFAPQNVQRAAIRFSHRVSTSSDRKLIRDYSWSPEFTRIAEQLSAVHQYRKAIQRGKKYNLNEVFNRVNQAYFNGELKQPALTWSKQILRSSLGSYRSRQDLVTLNKVLDHTGVPAFVVEFVMYHELLHKALGVTRINGRNQVHTAEFTNLEKQFKNYKEAQNFIHTKLLIKRRIL